MTQVYTIALASGGWLYGVIVRRRPTLIDEGKSRAAACLQEFHRIAQLVKRQQPTSTVLSERFQLREIENILVSLRPTIFAFGLTGSVCGLSMTVCWYLHFRHGYALGVGLTQAITNVRLRVQTFCTLQNNLQTAHRCLQIEYIAGGIYNCFSTIIFAHNLPSLRRVIIGDLRRLFCLQTTVVQPAAKPIDYEAEREAQFEYVRNAWKTSVAPPKLFEVANK